MFLCLRPTIYAIMYPLAMESKL